jgi:hypothetical protein
MSPRAQAQISTLVLALLVTRSPAASPTEAAPTPTAAIADPGERAVEIGRAALEAYSRADWDMAYAGFAEAEALVHSPVFVLYMARCQRNRGRLLEARRLLRSAAQEQLAPDAAAPWSQAVVAAHAELGALQQVIPSVSIRVRPRAVVERATIGGRAVPLSATGAELELDPGEHVLELWHDGVRARRMIRVPEGRRRVPIWLPFEEPPPAAKPQGAAPASAESPSPQRIAGYVGLGIGALGIVTGLVTGLIAKARTDQVKQDHCDGSGDCYRQAQPELEAAADWAAISTVSFIFGSSALAASAGVLLFTPSTNAARGGLIVRGAF